MRKLVWLAVGTVLACAAAAYLLSANALILLAAVSAFGVLGFAFWKHPLCKRMAWLLVGCAIAFGWFWCFDSLYLKAARACDGKTQPLTVEVTDYSEQTQWGAKVTGRIQLDGRYYSIIAYLNDYRILKPGDQFTGAFKLRYTGSGGDRPIADFEAEGLFLLAYAEDGVRLSYGDKMPWYGIAPAFRRHLLTILEDAFPEDTMGFAQALLLGSSENLSYEDDEAFRTSGIRHIIAVSGLHVSILFSLLYTLLGRRRWLCALIGIPVLVLFAGLAGFTPSVVRACIMQGLILLANILDRQYDPPTALAFAVLVILGVNPLSVTSVSFQLSAGCITGIFLFSSRVHRFLLHEKRLGSARGKDIKAILKRWFAGSVSGTFGALSLTLPLCAAHFGTVCIIGILTNLLTLWVITFIFCGILAVCFVSLFAPVLGTAAAWVVSWPMRYVLGIAKLFAAVPYATVSADNIFVALWMVFCYAGFAVLLLQKRKRPMLLCICAAAGLVLTLLAAAIEPRLANYRMSVLDVQQGQCVLLQSKDGCYIVDCGGSNAKSAAAQAVLTLRTQGIYHIDGLILTHFDTDHTGGAQYLLQQIDVENIYIPNADADDPLHQHLKATYRDAMRYVDADLTLSCGNAALTVYPGQASGNESSLCVLFQGENCDILITGDRNKTAERYLLEQAKLPYVEILVAGHHGAASSTSWELLDRIRPKMAIISVGRNNTYGHPAQSVLELLDFFGCSIYRTDLHGTITVRG